LDRSTDTVGLDTAVSGLDSVGFDVFGLDSIGRSREEGNGLVDVGLADAHGGVSCCWDPSLFGMVLIGFLP
jgi:hypothetical protein